MLAHELKPPKGAKHTRKRVGRGNSAGGGTYSGRGLKGQKSRAGHKPKVGFEGGQTRLIKRLPRRRGFTNPFRVEYTPVNLRDLQRFPADTEVTLELLRASRLIKTVRKPVKVLAVGELSKALKVSAHKFSKSAKEKIEAAGGSVQEIAGPPAGEETVTAEETSDGDGG
jgi:large subunit ribosomal protein L15